MDVAQAIVMFVQIWGTIGVVTAVVFLTFGIDRVDEDARGAFVFRPLLIPGVMLIWPLVLWRWWRIESESAGWAGRYRPVRQAHGVAAILMSVGIVCVVIAGLSVRQTWPADAKPAQLSNESGQ